MPRRYASISTATKRNLTRSSKVSYYALLTPDGRLIKCGDWQHDRIARELGFDSAWTAVQRGNYVHLSGRYFAVRSLDDITQAQHDAIFDWEISTGEKAQIVMAK